MHSQPLAILDRPIVPMLVLATFGMLAFVPLWHVEAQDAPPASPAKLSFVQDRQCAAAHVHRRLLDAFDRGERAEIVAFLRAPDSPQKAADCELVVDGPEQGAEHLRGEFAVDRLLELWPPLETSAVKAGDGERHTRIERCAVLEASPRCAMVVLEIARPERTDAEDQIEKTTRFWITSVVVRDGNRPLAEGVTAAPAAARHGEREPLPNDVPRIAHLHVSRAG
ncbi:MAG: hypothetical protein IPN34_18450 [Planctomycetes bacterium]|nr:hypothetical protein [Planctomycetota bacterium]